MIKRLLPIFILVMILLPTSLTVEAKNFEPQSITDPNKPWTITFSHEANADSLTDHSIYIENSSEERHPVLYTLSDDFKKVKVEPQQPYRYGEQYVLVISKEVSSINGRKLKSDVRKEFSLQGNYILKIDALLNSLITNVKVQSVKDVTKMTVLINDVTEHDLKIGENYTFSRGVLGLAPGDHLLVSAFDASGNLLEKIPYIIANE